MRWASDTMKSLYDGSAKDDLSSLGAKTGRESLVSSEPSTEPGVSSAVTVKLDISTCCAPMEGTSHAACTLPKGGHLAINSGILAFGEPWRFGGGEVDLDGLLFDLKHSATAGSVGTLKFNSMLQFGCCETDIARALVEATEQASWKLIAAVAPSILQVDALDLAKRGLPSLDGGPSFYAGVGDTVQGLVNNISLLKETEGSLDACARTPGLGVNVQAWVPIFCRFYTACAQAIDEAVGDLAPGEREIQSGHHPFSHSCDAMFEEIGRGEHASRRAAERT